MSQDFNDQFHQRFYDSGINQEGTWYYTTWMGVSTRKCPFDLWVYQEIIAEIKPELIVETGTLFGGSAFFMSHICDLLGQGHVLTIDIENRPIPRHPRLSRIVGSSIHPKTIEQVKQFALERGPILVILDSDHHAEHVLQELRLYSPFVSPGSYLIVEDTNVNGHPVFPDHGPGPMEAVQSFLKENSDFIVDRSREKFFLTFNPFGFLKKKG